MSAQCVPATGEIQARVARVLAESLNADEEDVTPGATLQGDLGAESIDFLDILFRLEREFGIKIPRDELFPESIFQAAPEFVQEGRVTDKGLEEVRARMPFADLSGLEGDRRLSAVPDLFTVGLVSSYVAWKLGRGGPARGAGGSSPGGGSRPSPATAR
jgi:acyl carrier protein